MWHVSVPLGCPGCEFLHLSLVFMPWAAWRSTICVLQEIPRLGLLCFLLIGLDRLVSWGCYPKCCKLELTLSVLEARLPNSRCDRAMLSLEAQGRFPSCLSQLLGAPMSLGLWLPHPSLCLCHHMAICSVSPLQVSHKDTG